MYSQAQEYLIGKLKEAGLKTKPHTTKKSIERSQESHVGAVLFGSEAFVRNGSKKYYKDQTGAQKKRRKVFDRTLTFSVIIGDYTADAVEAMLERLLSGLDCGIMVAGNFVPIEVDEAEWAYDDDSTLKAKVAVEMKIRFEGGIYKDTGIGTISRVEIASVESSRKEPTDGE